MKSKILLLGFAGLSSLCINLSAFSDVPAKHVPAASTNKARHSWSDGLYIKAGLGGIKYRHFKALENLYTSKKAPKGSLVYQAGIGYKINQNFRTDFTLQYAEMKHKARASASLVTWKTKQKIKNLTGFLNAYGQIEVQKLFYPYITAGIGFSRNKVGDFYQIFPNGQSIIFKGKNKTGLAWNVGAGVQLTVYKNFALDVGYRFSDLYKIKIQDLDEDNRGGSQKVRGHEGLISLIYQF